MQERERVSVSCGGRFEVHLHTLQKLVYFTIGRYQWEKGLSRIHIVAAAVVVVVESRGKKETNYLHSVGWKMKPFSLNVCTCV